MINVISMQFKPDELFASLSKAFNISDMYCMNDFRRTFESKCNVVILESKNFANFIDDEDIPPIELISSYHYFKFKKPDEVKSDILIA